VSTSTSSFAPATIEIFLFSMFFYFVFQIDIRGRPISQRSACFTRFEKMCKACVLIFALLQINVATAHGRNSGAVVQSRDLLGGDWSFLPASENGRIWQHRPAASQIANLANFDHLNNNI